MLLAVLALPGLAVAQHSSSASETLTFAVLPVHTVAAALKGTSVNTAKVTVSVEPPSDGVIAHSPLAVAHVLLTPGSPPIRVPRGSALIVTITD